MDAAPSLPSRAPAVRAVERAMASMGLPWRGRPVVVAASGGSDSTFLLLAACALRRRFGHDVVVAHVNHAWRGTESCDDARAVADLAVRLGVPVHLMTLPPPFARENGGPEAAARAARYWFLGEVARATGAVAVLVGHTEDDQAETVLLSLLRGRGVAGLAGMAAIGPLPSMEVRIVVARPMLGITDATIRATLEARGIAWREDATNADTARARNRLRHEAIPTLEAISPGFRAAVARSARHVRAMREVLAVAVGTAAGRWVRDSAGWSVARRDWMADPAPVRHEALREILVRVGVAAAAIEEAHLEGLARIITGNRGGAARVIGPATVSVRAGMVRVTLTADG